MLWIALPMKHIFVNPCPALYLTGYIVVISIHICIFINTFIIYFFILHCCFLQWTNQPKSFIYVACEFWKKWPIHFLSIHYNTFRKVQKLKIEVIFLISEWFCRQSEESKHQCENLSVMKRHHNESPQHWFLLWVPSVYS